MKKILLLLFFISTLSFGQNETKIDSIHKIIARSKSDSIISTLYYSLSLLHSNKDSVINQLNKSLYFSRKGKIPELITFSRNGIAAWKSKYVNRNAAMAEHYSSIVELKKYNFQKGLANNYIRLGYYYTTDATKKDSSNYFLKKGLEIAEVIKNNNLQLLAYQALGNIEYNNSNYNDALEIYIKYEKICAGNKQYTGNINHAHILHRIGDILLRTTEHKKALEYFSKAKEYYIKNGNKIDLIELNLSIVDVYIVLKQYKKALDIINGCESSISDFKLDVTRSSLLYSNKGLCLEKLNQNAQAEKYYVKAIKIAKEQKHNPTIISALTFIADYYLNSEQLVLAEKNYLEAEKIFKDTKDNETEKLIPIYNGLKKISEKQKNYDIAILFSNKMQEAEKIQKDKNIDSKLLELDAKFQNEKKGKEIQDLSSKNRILDLQNKLAAKQTYIFLGILGLLLTIATFLFYAYRNKIKTAQKLNELNELKSRFFANISHEFRTPLTLIKSPVQSLQSEVKDKNQKNKLDLIDKNANRMLELVDQLLELSKIDNGKLQLLLKDGNIGSFLASIIEPFDFQAKEKKFQFTSTIQKNDTNHHFDKDVIEKMVTNLLSNALKYTSENEKISFDSRIENNQLQIKVSNSGSDIKKEELPKLFERFYQKKENQQGVGIGLALVKELVELYKGKIETNLENDILSFTILIPLEKSNTNAIIVTQEKQKTTTNNILNSENEFPILLIVDDNAEIRNVLTDIFKENYQILEANDGEQALKIAQKQIPDCIISDVMMPKIDGFEFTKAIKSNELTSFIPVILLTAKTSDEAHLEGIKSTADAYLTKPFNNKIVKETVTKLINERKKLQERYSQELVLRPVDIVINSVDEKFIEKLQHVLDKELSNADFSTDNFAVAIGMSRMQLHRKLKSLLGVSATEFLRNERLKTATKLLKKGNGNISDIAYAVGFNDVSYFSKCFKEMYDCTPTEFLEKQ
ncbi:MAG: response regulator [Flavobacterium sp.]|uniref:hybrid sensor histidine kinase/response regulator transcription factor n=1 Tax=Flavobacterium sp. TaxID=239 RepID=UPI003265AE4A